MSADLMQPAAETWSRSRRSGLLLAVLGEQADVYLQACPIGRPAPNPELPPGGSTMRAVLPLRPECWPRRLCCKIETIHPSRLPIRRPSGHQSLPGALQGRFTLWRERNPSIPRLTAEQHPSRQHLARRDRTVTNATVLQPIRRECCWSQVAGRFITPTIVSTWHRSVILRSPSLAYWHAGTGGGQLVRLQFN